MIRDRNSLALSILCTKALAGEKKKQSNVLLDNCQSLNRGQAPSEVSISVWFPDHVQRPCKRRNTTRLVKLININMFCC